MDFHGLNRATSLVRGNEMDQAWGAFRYTMRGFLRSPLFTVIAVLGLALGIGANTAILSLLDKVILRLSAVENQQQLAEFKMRGQHYGGSSEIHKTSYPIYRDSRDQAAIGDVLIATRDLYTGAPKTKQ